MLFTIDAHSVLPNYQQLILQIKKNIIQGKLKANDQLPSIRSLSKELNVAIVTIKRTYEELEKQGIIYTQGGKGVFVSDVDIIQLKQELQSDLVKELSKTIQLANYFGFDDNDIEIMLERAKHHDK